jgi:GxxExxY protein
MNNTKQNTKHEGHDDPEGHEHHLRGQRVDVIVENLIVVELKGVAKLNEIHRAQVLSYLRATGLRGGLLINFHVPVLRNGLKRIVL